MSNAKDSFRIDLTPEQKATIRNATGKDAEAVELSVEELEARIAPIKITRDSRALATKPGRPITLDLL